MMNDQDNEKRACLQKIIISAASVMLGTSLFVCRAQLAKADTVTATSAKTSKVTSAPQTPTPAQVLAKNTAKVTTPAVAPQTTQTAQTASAPKVLAKSAPTSPAASQAKTQPKVNARNEQPNAQQTAGKEIKSSDYKVNAHDVYKTNGQTEHEKGHISASISLTFPDTSKINDGDYLDIKLGAPTQDGKYVNYADTTAGPAAVNVSDPTIDLNLVWRSNQQQAVTLTGYTDQRGKDDTIAPTNDLVIGDKLSNHFTVTVQVPDPAGNSYFTPEFASDADVAQQIQDSIRNQQTNVQVHDQLAQDNSIGVGATLDSSHAMVPSVRVHSTAGTNDDDYQVRNYKIDINASQDIKLGNQPITFAIVHSRPGVDLTPASGLNSYAKDQASADQRAQAKANLMNSANWDTDFANALAHGQATQHDSWDFVVTYDGPELANQDLEKFMTAHEAGYVSIHDDANDANNDGYDHNVSFGDPAGQQDLANIDFLVNIATEPAKTSSYQENEVSATGSIADQSSFTVNYVDQDAHNQVLTLTAKAVM